MVRLHLLVPLGLATNALALILFALVIMPGMTDRVLLLAEAAAVLLAAWGLRDWDGFASEGIAATGFALYAVFELIHIGTAVASGLAGIGLSAFVIYVLGTLTAAAGAVWWQRTAAGSTPAMHVVRTGCGLVALANVAFIALGPGSALAGIVSVLGVTGMGLVAWAFAPAPGTHVGATPLASG